MVALPFKRMCPRVRAFIINVRFSGYRSRSMWRWIIERKAPESPAERIGIASLDACPRAGFIRLYNKFGMSVTMPTKCKTWRCNGCRDRALAVVRGRIQSGCYSLGRCYFITLTFRMGEGCQQDADSVRVVWTRFLRTWKSKHPEMSWFRVVEATKRSQPHLHLLMGGLGIRRDVCDRDHSWKDVDWAFEDCPQKCLEHEISYDWFNETGDSYVVAVRLVQGPAGAASYITKYMVKAITHREVLYGLGFKRLFSTSRNWPGLAKMQLKGTADDKWTRTEFQYAGRAGAKVFEDHAELTKDSPLADRVGTPLAQYFEAKIKKAHGKKILKGITNAANRT